MLITSRKTLNAQPAEPQSNANVITQAWRNGLVNPSDIVNPDARRWSGSAMSNDGDEFPSHVPHAICKPVNLRCKSHNLTTKDQNVTKQIDKGEILRRAGYIHQNPQYDAEAFHALLTSAAPSGDRTRSRVEDSPATPAAPHMPMLKHVLPGYLKPLPQRMTSVDIDYLFAKGALSLPDITVRNALLRSYLEYVHPYMPLVEVHDLLQIIDDGTGESGRISLLLFQAIMFAGTAFVDMEMLRAAGYTNRKTARKAFFQKARVSLPSLTIGLLLISAGTLRLRLRNRSRLPRSVAPPYDILVRDTRRSERYMALDGSSNLVGTYNWTASRPLKVEYGTK